MATFSQQIAKSSLNEQGFLKRLKNHLQSSGVGNSQASIRTGYSVGESSTTYRDDNYNKIGTGSTSTSSDSYTLYNNPFNVYFTQAENKYFGTYRGRIQVDLQNDFYEQNGSVNMHYYNYRVSGHLRWTIAGIITWIVIIGITSLGIYASMFAELGALFIVFLAIGVAAGIAQNVYFKQQGKKYMNDAINKINNSLLAYSENN